MERGGSTVKLEETEDCVEKLGETFCSVRQQIILQILRFEIVILRDELLALLEGGNAQVEAFQGDLKKDKTIASPGHAADLESLMDEATHLTQNRKVSRSTKVM